MKVAFAELAGVLTVEVKDGSATFRRIDGGLEITTGTQLSKLVRRTMAKSKVRYSYVVDGITKYGELPAHIVVLRPNPSCAEEKTAQDGVVLKAVGIAAYALVGSPTNEAMTGDSLVSVAETNLARLEQGLPALPVPSLAVGSMTLKSAAS